MLGQRRRNMAQHGINIGIVFTSGGHTSQLLIPPGGALLNGSARPPGRSPSDRRSPAMLCQRAITPTPPVSYDSLYLF